MIIVNGIMSFDYIDTNWWLLRIDPTRSFDCIAKRKKMFCNWLPSSSWPSTSMLPHTQNHLQFAFVLHVNQSKWNRVHGQRYRYCSRTHQQQRRQSITFFARIIIIYCSSFVKCQRALWLQQSRHNQIVDWNNGKKKIEQNWMRVR